MDTISLNRISISDWDVKWGSYHFGGVDKVTPDLKLTTKPKKVGSMGDVKLGDWIIGLEGSIKVQAREIDHAFYETIVAWNNGTAITSVPMFVATKPDDLYNYAQQLTLHPSHLASNVVNLDVILLKAVPLMPYPGARDGVADDVNEIDFVFYPDRSSFPNLVYGHIGA